MIPRATQLTGPILRAEANPYPKIADWSANSIACIFPETFGPALPREDGTVARGPLVARDDEKLPEEISASEQLVPRFIAGPPGYRAYPPDRV